MCLKDLRMENGAISDTQIRASSMWDNNHAPGQGRLNFQETTVKSGCWSARTNDVNQWLQIDLGRLGKIVTRIATQGRNYNGQWPWGPHSQWVIKYTLQYSVNGVNFDDYRDVERNTIQASLNPLFGAHITVCNTLLILTKLEITGPSWVAQNICAPAKGGTVLYKGALYALSYEILW